MVLYSKPGIYDLLFKQILGLKECTGTLAQSKWAWGCINYDFAHDFIMVLFVPIVVGITFYWMVSKPITHAGIRWLILVAGAAMGIYLGFYPLFAMLAPWWIIGLFGIGFVFFLLGRFFPPGKVAAMTRTAELLGRGMMEKLKSGELSYEQLIALRSKIAAEVAKNPKDPKIAETFERIDRMIKRMEKEGGARE